METESFAQLMDRGRTHYMAGEFVQASHCLREAAGLSPSAPDVWRALGFALISSGNPPDAIGAFRSAIELDPDDVDSHYGLGLVHVESGDHRAGIEWFEKALVLKPGHKRAKASLVSALVKYGQLRILSGDKAGREPLARANALEPGSPETVLPLVDYLTEIKDYGAAFDIVLNAKKANPQDPKIKELFDLLDRDPRFVRMRREQGLV